MTMVDAPVAELDDPDELDDIDPVAQVEAGLAWLRAASSEFDEFARQVDRLLLELDRLDRLAAAPPELEPLAAIVAAARHGRCQLLAAAMARRRKAERPRLATGAFRTSGRQQRAIQLQRDTAAAAMSSCRSRRAP